MNEMFVPCGLCGKMVNPNTAYYLARRSKTIGASGDWEYFGVSPVFFACSYGHYMAQLIDLEMEWKEMSMKALDVIPSTKDKTAKE